MDLGRLVPAVAQDSSAVRSQAQCEIYSWAPKILAAPQASWQRPLPAGTPEQDQQSSEQTHPPADQSQLLGRPRLPLLTFPRGGQDSGGISTLRSAGVCVRV